MNTIVGIRDPRTLLENRVRELRLGKDLSQEKLTELHLNFVRAIERGQKNIGPVSLVKLAHALSVNRRYYWTPTLVCCAARLPEVDQIDSPSSKRLRQRWATRACARVVVGIFQRLNTHILLGMIC